MLTSSSRQQRGRNDRESVREDDVRVLTSSSRAEGTGNAGKIVREDDVRVLTSSSSAKGATEMEEGGVGKRIRVDRPANPEWIYYLYERELWGMLSARSSRTFQA